MSIRSKYSDSEIKKMSKEAYMRDASYDDILELNYKKFNVATLIRESTNHADQIKAFKIQKDSILKMIESKDHFLLEKTNIFEEQGKSGLRAADRPAFQLMCQRAGKHKFDILIVDSVSRLARNVKELFAVIDDLRELGIGILIIKERYWTYNMIYTDILRLAVDGGLAQAESMNTGKRVENHMVEIAKSGQLLGGNMFGYRLKKDYENPKNNSLIQEPVEAYTVKVMFELFGSDNPNEVKTSSSLCKYLIDNNMRTYNGDLNWTPSKVIRVLDNTKYMGYQIPEKSKVVDTVKKKKVLTHVEPEQDILDEKGVVIKKGNLVKIKCEPIVSEELWWKVHNRKASRSCKDSENIKGRKSGLRVSSDAYGRKAFCSCGYCLSRQYTHVARGDKTAQYRYKCRWQIDHANKYTVEAAKKENRIICSNSAVSEMKLWLTSKYVFEYIFKNGKSAIMQTLELIEQCRQDEEVSEGTSIQGLEEERAKLKKRISSYQDMRADGDMTSNEYKEKRAEADMRIDEIDRLIAQYEIDKSKNQKRAYDMTQIKERLEMFIDLRNYKVSDEMIDMFVERIIYRGNDEFLWVINFSGEISDTSAKYRIKEYSKEYSDFLKDDKNFNIVARMSISLEECRRYCEKELHRRFVPAYWQPLMVKIAIQ